MRRIASVIMGTVLAASALVVASPTSASACDRHPCHPTCKINRDYVDVENGTIGNGRLIDCYY